jgi:UDP-N-acetylglucosamine 2-epimerase (non-hydrolysing)
MIMPFPSAGGKPNEDGRCEVRRATEERTRAMAIKIVSVVGARPNFMKIVPIEMEFRKRPQFQHEILHTGQHYDRKMSDVFFDQLALPKPSWHLGVGSGGHGEMTGKIMIEFEKVCMEIEPQMVVVVGDVNSTIAASLVARKLSIPVAHVEAGLRSFDESMPEELNRRLTDCLSNVLFVSEPTGMENLRREGVDPSRTHLVGDIMLETLQIFFDKIRARRRWEDFGLKRGEYALVTIHRPSNVDTPDALEEVIKMLTLLGLPIVFPVHPRTMQRINDFGFKAMFETIPCLVQIPPESYVDFLSLLEGSTLMLSDSGSVQSEASFFGIPCLVCRENTERPIYVEHGTSVLVGRDHTLLNFFLQVIRAGGFRKADKLVQELGTGVAEKIVGTIAGFFGERESL